MKNDKLLKLAEDLVKHGTKLGADEVQISISTDNDFEVEIMNQEIEKLNQSNPTNIGIKVISENKVATASSSDMRIETLNNLVANAVERAKLSSADPYSGLPEKEEMTIEPEKLNLYDESIINMQPEAKINFAKEIERIGMENDKIKTSSGSYYATSFGESILANSKGFTGTYQYTGCYAGGGFQSGSGDNLVEDYWGESKLKLSEMPKPDQIANTAVKRVVRMIGAEKVKSQIVPIVFDPQMTASLLGFLAGCIMGSSIYMNRSFLVDKLNTQIAASNINIIDDPLMPGKIGSRPYDSEGVPGRKMNIVENGVLKNYLLDTYSGKKLDMKTNGHASGPSNMYLEKGKYTPEEIVASVKNGLYLTKTIGQGTMPTTGDISKGAYGIWIENGKLTKPVAEITYSGNLADMLMNIEMVGNDLNFRRSINGPTIKINNVSISGT